MGTAKQLLPWGDTTLAGHAAAVAVEAGLSPVVAVVGARAPEVAAAFPPAVETVLNELWQRGPGGSIAAGVRHVVERHPDVSAVLVSPADLPRVTAADLRRLSEARRNSAAGVAASAFGDILGAPACFDRRHFADLLALNPAYGAGQLIRRLGAGVAAVALAAAAEDVDRPEDYRRLTAPAEAGG